ncbi:MAG: BamA/TamA family outer membrane protein, partial [Candidatus Halalkalibacterium sp. M3_1C_030]
YHVLLRPTLWLDNRFVNLSGKFSFKKWPTNFYGIGNINSLESPEKFTETLYEASVEATSHLGSDYFAGAAFTYRRAKIDPLNDNGILSSGRVSGSGESMLSSAGVVLRKDSRDNHFYPSEGSYHSLAITFSNKNLGSDFSFTRYTLDLRRYLSLGGNHVLAMQGFLFLTSGKPPFRMLSSVGSTLRGYSTVRYIDQHTAAMQVEYRAAALMGRIGFVAFAGMGDVFGNLNDLQLGRLKFSAGMGIRYLFSRAEKINIRVDYAIGRDSSGDYIDLNEAF